MAQVADKIISAEAKPSGATVALASSALVPTSDRSVVIPRDSRGHFQTDARVEGHYLPFMIDTRASVVALSESGAARAGVHPRPGDFKAPVTTANGRVKAAPVRLA